MKAIQLERNRARVIIQVCQAPKPVCFVLYCVGPGEMHRAMMPVGGRQILGAKGPRRARERLKGVRPKGPV